MDKWFILTRGEDGVPYFYQKKTFGRCEWTTNLERAKFYDSRLTVHLICMRWKNSNNSFKENAKYDEYVTFTEDIASK